MVLRSTLFFYNITSEQLNSLYREAMNRLPSICIHVQYATGMENVPVVTLFMQCAQREHSRMHNSNNNKNIPTLWMDDHSEGQS